MDVNAAEPFGRCADQPESIAHLLIYTGNGAVRETSRTFRAAASVYVSHASLRVHQISLESNQRSKSYAGSNGNNTL